MAPGLAARQASRGGGLAGGNRGLGRADHDDATARVNDHGRGAFHAPGLRREEEVSAQIERIARARSAMARRRPLNLAARRGELAISGTRDARAIS